MLPRRALSLVLFIVLGLTAPSSTICGPPTILTHPECAMLLEPLARCAADQESHQPCCAMTNLFTRSGCFCEDNCRDSNGEINMQLQHLVMRELGLHTLTQFCERGAQANGGDVDEFFRHGAEWFAQAVESIQHQPPTSDMLLHAGSLPVAVAHKDALDSYRQAVAAAESRLKTSTAHKLATTTLNTASRTHQANPSTPTAPPTHQQHYADNEDGITASMIVYSDGMPYEHAEDAVLAAAYHNVMPSDAVDAYYEYVNPEEERFPDTLIHHQFNKKNSNDVVYDNSNRDTSVFNGQYSDDDNNQLYDHIVILDNDQQNNDDDEQQNNNNGGEQYDMDYTLSGWFDMVANGIVGLPTFPCLSDIVSQVGAFLTSPLSVWDTEDNDTTMTTTASQPLYGQSRRAGPRERPPFGDTPFQQDTPLQENIPHGARRPAYIPWDAAVFTSDVLDAMRFKYLQATAAAAMQHAQQQEGPVGVQSATQDEHTNAQSPFVQEEAYHVWAAGDVWPGGAVWAPEDAVHKNEALMYATPGDVLQQQSQEQVGKEVVGQVVVGQNAPAILGWEAVDRKQQQQGIGSGGEYNTENSNRDDAQRVDAPVDDDDEGMWKTAMGDAVGYGLRDRVVTDHHGVMYEPVWETEEEGWTVVNRVEAARTTLLARMAAHQAALNILNAPVWRHVLHYANTHYWSVLLALSTLNMLCFAVLMGRLWWLEQRCEQQHQEEEVEGVEEGVAASSLPLAAALTTNPLLETADVTAFIEEMARALEASPSSSCPYYHQSTTEDEKRRPLLQHRH